MLSCTATVWLKFIDFIEEVNSGKQIRSKFGQLAPLQRPDRFMREACLSAVNDITGDGQQRRVHVIKHREQ